MGLRFFTDGVCLSFRNLLGEILNRYNSKKKFIYVSLMRFMTQRIFSRRQKHCPYSNTDRNLALRLNFYLSITEQ